MFSGGGLGQIGATIWKYDGMTSHNNPEFRVAHIARMCHYTVIKSTRNNASGIEQPTCEYLKSMEITQSSCRTFFDSL
jgi:hypothetical protein